VAHEECRVEEFSIADCRWSIKNAKGILAIGSRQLKFEHRQGGKIAKNTLGPYGRKKEKQLSRGRHRS
jgi:hypothetical protein